MSATHHHYRQIAEAIDYLRTHFRRQPSLDEVAEHMHMSPFHFQRLFTEWAGVSPKKFVQYLSVDYAKHLLKEKQASLFDTALETGLSGTGRLHDLFITLEGMTPGEFKNGGAGLILKYQFSESPFGTVLLASTEKGICHLAFVEEHGSALDALQRSFPAAELREGASPLHEAALHYFMQNSTPSSPIHLHLKGTPFQLKVWEALLKIPMGKLSTYAAVAEQVDNARASRAVGTAIGSNPVAFLIPCHRVIQSSGIISGYAWGPTRKAAILGWEAARVDSDR